MIGEIDYFSDFRVVDVLRQIVVGNQVRYGPRRVLKQQIAQLLQSVYVEHLRTKIHSIAKIAEEDSPKRSHFFHYRHEGRQPLQECIEFLLGLGLRRRPVQAVSHTQALRARPAEDDLPLDLLLGRCTHRRAVQDHPLIAVQHRQVAQ